MKPIRKVQAQRKFAQGAYAPAIASTSGAASAGSQEKRSREPPRDQHLVRVQVPASVLLDIVSFNKVHQHVQPVVLIERLKSFTIQKTKVTDKKNKVYKVAQEKNSVKGRKKTKRAPKNHVKTLRRTYSWDMTLRSSNTKRDKMVPKQVRKRTRAQDQGKNAKRSRVSMDFTVDDNRPLTHFAKIADKKNTLHKETVKAMKKIPKKAQRLRSSHYQTSPQPDRPKTMQQEQTSLQPERPQFIPPQDQTSSLVQETNGRESKLGTFSPTMVDTPGPKAGLDRDSNLGTHSPNVVESPEPMAVHGRVFNQDPSTMVVIETLEPIDELDRDNDSMTMVLINSLEEMEELEPQPGPSGLQTRHTSAALAHPAAPRGGDGHGSVLDTSECGQFRGFLIANDSAVPYYNDHGIQKWISGSQSSPSASAKIGSVDTLDGGSEYNPGQPTHPVPCPATAWLTMRQVLMAPSCELDARCTHCVTCISVRKIFQLSNLLRKKRQPTYAGENRLEAAGPLPGDENTKVSSNGDLFMELLPCHAKFMIKHKIQKPLGRQILSVSLVSRTDAETNEDLNFVKHADIVEQYFSMYKLNTAESEPTGADDVAISVDISSPVSVRSESNSDAGLKQRSFPNTVDKAKVVDAPVFYPTADEFRDPIAYFEKIGPIASKFGICKVIPPHPSRFAPKCKINDDLRFDVTNQYISRLFNRWGPAARELCAIKACLTSQNFNVTRSPLLDGIEVNLPKLYHVVQSYGGLEKVIDTSHWPRVAEDLGFGKISNPEKRLDNIYVKYLLPYNSLAHNERQVIIRRVEKYWNKRNQRMLDRAMNPLHRQKRLLGESDSSGDESGDESLVGNALAQSEDCIVPGTSMNLGKFKRVATMALEHNFRTTTAPSADMVEERYWQLVLLGTEHVCVNTASIDTGDEGYGFTTNPHDSFSKHPWNLKMLSKNSSNVLRSLGPVLGLTVPSLHLSMVFSTSCWHSDPHGLPWIEYMHQGSTKIWYGIPQEQSQNFRKAAETLCPTSCQNKGIWLPSDITMIPPTLLNGHNVSLSKVTQNPGEFIMVYPKAYSCSISTGYTLSESVYFATYSWLSSVHEVFKELRESCEPAMFSLEQLLLAVAKDSRTPVSLIRDLQPTLSAILSDELSYRVRLREMSLQIIKDTKREHVFNRTRRNTSAWNVRDQDECEVCRMTLYLSKVSGLPGRRSSLCLEHALRLLECDVSEEIDMDSLQAVVYVSDEEITNAIEQVQRRFEQDGAGSSGLKGLR